MATSQSFVDHIVEQADLGDRFTCRKMFGEYGFHLDGKFVALACDDTFFVKETAALANLGLELPSRPPYPGAKPYPIADELIEAPARLRQVLLDTAAQLPAPKPKRSKPKRGNTRTVKSKGARKR